MRPHLQHVKSSSVLCVIYKPQPYLPNALRHRLHPIVPSSRPHFHVCCGARLAIDMLRPAHITSCYIWVVLSCT